MSQAVFTSFFPHSLIKPYLYFTLFWAESQVFIESFLGIGEMELMIGLEPTTRRIRYKYK
jgi:hypothetical protein